MWVACAVAWRAVNAAFDAMSAWRLDIANGNEKHSEQVIKKMVGAARALGWPEQIVDATRGQFQSITKAQIQMRVVVIGSPSKTLKRLRDGNISCRPTRSLARSGLFVKTDTAAQIADLCYEAHFLKRR